MTQKEVALKLLRTLPQSEALLEAFVEGKTIQTFVAGKWVDGMPLIRDAIDAPEKMRVRPGPKRIWINEYKSGSVMFEQYSEALDYAAHSGAPIRLAVPFEEVNPL